MPYVNESSSDPNRIFAVGSSKPYGLMSLPNGKHRSQYGFRSRHLTPEEAASIETGPSNSATMLSHIRLLEETSGDLSQVGFKKHDMRFWPTNRRDYRETSYYPTGFNAQLDFRHVYPYNTPNKVSLLGAHGIVSSSLVLPNDPSVTAARSMAGSLLRESRPPVERFNLARSIAELKDAPLLMRMGNYFPRSPKDLGGAVLNFLFGLKPTGEDIGKALALAIKTQASVLSLLDQENVQERRYNIKELLNESNSATIRMNLHTAINGGVQFTAGPMTMRGAYFTWNGVSGNYGNIMDAMLTWSTYTKQSIRTHATWEYFVPMPFGLRERLPAYRLAAENLLGTFKFDASVVYDLTPWTWLGNWFADIGGLLRYQQAIVDNQQVMTNSGYTITTENVGTVTLDGQVSNGKIGYPYFKMYSIDHPASTSSYRHKRVIREPCSPYAVGPTWDFSLQQWGILGALGLSRGFGIPNIR